jgi:hypothetical protein
MAKFTINNFISFILISIGTMTTMTFGFVPLINLYEKYFDIIYLLLFWGPFGLSCLLFGTFIDKIRGDFRKGFSFSYIAWGVLVICLNFAYNNLILTLSLIVVIATLTGLNVITAVSYISSNLEMTKKGFISGIFLGLGWGLVSITAYISYVNIFLNFTLLGILNIFTGILCFYFTSTGKLEFE